MTVIKLYGRAEETVKGVIQGRGGTVDVVNVK